MKKKFEKYLELLFSDLCAKDNGNQHKSFGLYTFIKVSTPNYYFLYSMRKVCLHFYPLDYFQL